MTVQTMRTMYILNPISNYYHLTLLTIVWPLIIMTPEHCGRPRQSFPWYASHWFWKYFTRVTLALIKLSSYNLWSIKSAKVPHIFSCRQKQWMQNLRRDLMKLKQWLELRCTIGPYWFPLNSNPIEYQINIQRGWFICVASAWLFVYKHTQY